MIGPKAVVFDFDGLITDTESVEYETWRQEFLDRGLDLALSDWLKCVGAGPDAWSVTEHLQELCSEKLDLDAIIQNRLEAVKARAHTLAPRDGIERWVLELKERSIPFGVASSSLYEWVDDHLKLLDLRDHFNVVVTRDQVERAKPFPDLYLEACRRLGAEPTQAAAFEDSLNGVKAAVAAGLFAVAIPGPITSGLDFSIASMLVASADELTWDGLAEAFDSARQTRM